MNAIEEELRLVDGGKNTHGSDLSDALRPRPARARCSRRRRGQIGAAAAHRRCVFTAEDDLAGKSRMKIGVERRRSNALGAARSPERLGSLRPGSSGSRGRPLRAAACRVWRSSSPWSWGGWDPLRARCRAAGAQIRVTASTATSTRRKGEGRHTQSERARAQTSRCMITRRCVRKPFLRSLATMFASSGGCSDGSSVAKPWRA